MFNIVSGHNMIKQMILLWKTGRQKHYFEREKSGKTCPWVGEIWKSFRKYGLVSS